MTAEQQAIHAKLSDRLWRLDNLYVILDENGVMAPFVARPEQREVRESAELREFIPKSRKLGMSTEIAIEFGDECVFSPNLRAAIVDKTDDDAHDKLQIFRFAWENGPKHPDPAIATIWQGIHAGNALVTDNEGEMAWSNGSRFEAGVSFVGGTINRLHVSEYGPIAAQKPAKAAEIKRGSMNAVPPGGKIKVETTMEGGPFGLCYELFQLALQGEAGWKFRFFPWHTHPSYVLPGQKPKRQETLEYIAECAKRGLALSDERWAWYELRKREQKDEMWSQFPTFADECVRSPVAGRIYPVITELRQKGRVREFEAEKIAPMYCAFDLGVSDATAGWVIQPAGKDLNWLDWCEWEGEGAARTADVIRGWEARHGKRFANILLPHDANIRDKGTGKTYVDALVAAGIDRGRIIVVQRAVDVWDGINAVRDLLPHSWFHSRTDEPRIGLGGESLPSGLGCLEAYRRAPPTPGGVIREMPLHDLTSHSADAARTFAEAVWNGVVKAGSFSGHGSPFNADPDWQPRRAKVVHGFRG